MTELQTLRLRESMVILDGGAGAALPDGKGGPVLAGPEAVFIAGRVATDAATVVRFVEEAACPDGFSRRTQASLRHLTDWFAS